MALRAGAAVLQTLARAIRATAGDAESALAEDFRPRSLTAGTRTRCTSWQPTLATTVVAANQTPHLDRRAAATFCLQQGDGQSSMQVLATPWIGTFCVVTQVAEEVAEAAAHSITGLD